MNDLSAKTYQLKPRLIGIDASRAFLKRRTGIEEYSYQVIKHLREVLPQDTEVVLYVRKKLEIENWKLKIRTPEIDFDLPENWTKCALWAPRFWTQIGLSLQMLLHRPDVLFVPAHTVPLIHPKRTVVTIHGLEYEMCPESYSWYERLYMRWSIRLSVKWASQIIAVSENTKRDLVRLYGVPEEKMGVIYEGIGNMNQESRIKNQEEKSQFPILNSQFFLFIGRLEERKNVWRIIEAFEYFKERTKLPYQLVLAGKPGFGYENIRSKIQESRFKNEIQERGYVTEGEKWELLQKAEVFIFPSLYEGFGLPVIEAQSVGTPVVTSNTSSLPEIAGEGAILVNPTRSKEIGRALVALVTDERRRADIIDRATRNADRFSWAACAQEVAQLLLPPKSSSLS